MTTRKPSLDAPTFDSIYVGHHGAAITNALRAVLVDGWEVSKAARTYGTSRSGLYRALEKHGASPSSFEVVSVACPVHRADQLRTLITRQLAIWAAKDAEPVAVELPSPASIEGSQP